MLAPEPSVNNKSIIYDIRTFFGKKRVDGKGIDLPRDVRKGIVAANARRLTDMMEMVEIVPEAQSRLEMQALQGVNDKNAQKAYLMERAGVGIERIKKNFALSASIL